MEKLKFTFIRKCVIKIRETEFSILYDFFPTYIFFLHNLYAMYTLNNKYIRGLYFQKTRKTNKKKKRTLSITVYNHVVYRTINKKIFQVLYLTSETSLLIQYRFFLFFFNYFL